MLSVLAVLSVFART